MRWGPVAHALGREAIEAAYADADGYLEAGTRVRGGATQVCYAGPHIHTALLKSRLPMAIALGPPRNAATLCV